MENKINYTTGFVILCFVCILGGLCMWSIMGDTIVGKAPIEISSNKAQWFWLGVICSGIAELIIMGFVRILEL